MKHQVTRAEENHRLSEAQITASLEALIVRCRAALSFYPPHHGLVEDILNLERQIDSARHPKTPEDLRRLYPDFHARSGPKPGPRPKRSIAKELKEEELAVGRLGKAAPVQEELTE